MDKSEQAVSVFNKRASDYQNRYMDVSGYHDTLDSLCQSLRRGAGLLELACGPGNITRYLLDKRPDLNIMATDLAPNMIDLAKANNPEAKIMLLDMRALAGTGKKYDCVVCGFGLPYLSKEETIAFIETLPQILHPGGLVYLSTMEGDHDASRLQKSSDGKDEIFIHFHEAAYLVAALENAGFEITLKKSQRFPLNQDTDLILIGKWNPKS